MGDRESRDLLRGLERRTPKKHKCWTSAQKLPDNKSCDLQECIRSMGASLRTDEDTENNVTFMRDSNSDLQECIRSMGANIRKDGDTENNVIFSRDSNILLNEITTKIDLLPVNTKVKCDLFRSKASTSDQESTSISDPLHTSSSSSASEYTSSDKDNVKQAQDKWNAQTHHAHTDKYSWSAAHYNNRGRYSQYNDSNYDTTHPVYRMISLLNGEINRMDLNQMKNRCKELTLDSNGKREAVKRRLKEYYKSEKLIEAGLLERKSNDERNSDFFIVVGGYNGM